MDTLSTALLNIAGLRHGWFIATANYLLIGLSLFFFLRMLKDRTAAGRLAFFLLEASCLLYASLGLIPYSTETNQGLALTAARSIISILLGAIGMLLLARSVNDSSNAKYLLYIISIIIIIETCCGFLFFDKIGFISSISWVLYFTCYSILPNSTGTQPQ
ncbi:hypothetical protein [Hymenobacter latericus]|uniref:hypothetical protein n=1 Tax=Hymenobacter sp. YIM 151858-1 TaxID=2987688 RepID=UPI0022268655|nr:hypothetical protein [Hymenobacter sp. YIM 151858-1]UYZ57551.1 hypothetical protein OIS50_10765 [Hymenobacter sp. YIM 151858-1]